MGGITAQRGGTGGASKALSNLADVAINAALIPDADSTRDLGTSATMWRDLYVDNLVGPTVFNEAGADKDFRFEGLTNPNLLSLDASLDAIGIGVIPIAGTKLALPIENDEATPTLAFGGGGDGLYSRTDTTLSFALQSTWAYNLSTTDLSAVVSGGFHASLRRVNPSATVPSVVPSVVTSSDTGIGLAAAGQLSLIAGSTEGVRVRNGLVAIPDGIGLVVGHTAQIDFGAIPELQILGTTTADSSMGFGIFENGTIGPDFRFLKSRGATIGSNVIVADGDRLGRIRFQGADGSDFNTTAAELQVEVDGATSANNIFGRFVWRTRSSGGLTTKMTLNKLGDLGLGTVTPDEILHTQRAVDGQFIGLLIENAQAAAGGSLNETAEIRFGFGGNNEVARISADKLKDYTSAPEEDSRIGFWVDDAGVLTEIAHIMPDGLMLVLPGAKIRFAGTTGGGGSIQYKDSGGSMRTSLLFPGNDLVTLGNRAVNGVVEIRANTATGGNPGEVTVATFEDDLVTFVTNIEIGSEGGGTRRLAIKGSDATGSAEGGEIQLFLADDFDTTIASYSIDAFQDDLRFFGAGGNPQMTLTAEGYFVMGSGGKTTTGDPTGREGMIYWNTVDDRIRMFAEGAWRTLAFW